MPERSPDISDKLQTRAQRKADKREARKAEISASTLSALKQLGYANTTMRDIASQSGMSLGSLSYYFVGKEDLITYCVRLYKTEFIDRVAGSVVPSRGRSDIIRGLSVELVRSIVEDRSAHRLWYDIRNQAMFDPGFEPVVSEIEEKLSEVFAQAMIGAGYSDIRAAATGYAMIDGLFRYLMQAHDSGKIGEDVLEAQFIAALERLL